MAKNRVAKVFELVLVGHPDKVCDLVSNEICKANFSGRNAIECMWGNELFVISGETDYKWEDSFLFKFVREVLLNTVGLTPREVGRIRFVNNLNIQSVEINSIVGDSGAGDNGIFYGGYHRVYSPVIARMKQLCSALTAKVLADWGYRTDGKFIFDVDERGNIVYLTMNCAKFVSKDADAESFEAFIRTFTGAGTLISINPKGDWSKCFGFADTGLTGRKLACDSQCGLFSHGGGAMFGKDSSKADITVPLYLNYLAEHTVGRRDKQCVFEASSIIGDEYLTVVRNGKYYADISFAEMREYARKLPLNIFGGLH